MSDAIDPRDKTVMAVRLDELQRWQRVLEPVALFAIAVQGWAYFHLLAMDEGYAANVVIALISTFLNVWALHGRVRERGLLDKIGSPYV